MRDSNKNCANRNTFAVRLSPRAAQARQIDRKNVLGASALHTEFYFK